MYSNFIKTNIDLEISLLTTVKLLFELKEEQKAKDLTDRLMENARFRLTSLEQQEKVHIRELQVQLFIMRQLGELAREFGYRDIPEKFSDILLQYANDQ